MLGCLKALRCFRRVKGLGVGPNGLRLYSSSSSSSSHQGIKEAAGGKKQQSGRSKVKWGLGLALTGGVGLYLVNSFQQIRQIDHYINDQKDPHEVLPYNWQATIYRTLPYRAISRLWGKLTSTELPVFLRAPIYKSWAYIFGSNLDEIKAGSLDEYSSLAEFFVRELKEGARPYDKNDLVSPVDGAVLYFGTAENGLVEQVKGVTYSLRSFLGEKRLWEKTSPGNQLYQIVFYLAPGDYHRFHSPANWDVAIRKHFPGELLSVNPGVVKMVRGLFVFNERIVLNGIWTHGFFSMSAIGATNVGSMKIVFDKDIQTNLPTAILNGQPLEKKYLEELKLKQGDEVGSFNLGSTIVLIFEAPQSFHFTVQSGQKIKLGQSFGLMR
jgi:phosphatidylserine decarboxylase